MLRVGVIGSRGELGSFIRERLLQSGHTVVESDLSIRGGESIDEVARDVDILHVCISSSTIQRLPNTSALILLHDSVMQSSQLLIQRSGSVDAIAVHLLMNEADAAVLDSVNPHLEAAQGHLQTLHLTPHVMTIDQHDAFIEQTQLPLFKLLELLPNLREWSEVGLLTPSGQDLLTVLEKRAQSWSNMTLKSLKQHQSTLGVRYNEDND